MTSYCNLADLITRYSEKELAQATDRTDAHPPAVDEDVIDAAIADASAEIDTYLESGGYRTPLVQAPALLRSIACQLARAGLYTDMQRRAVGDKAAHPAHEAAASARAMLQEIAEGTRRIPGLPRPAGADVFTDETAAALTRDIGRLL